MTFQNNKHLDQIGAQAFYLTIQGWCPCSSFKLTFHLPQEIFFLFSFFFFHEHKKLEKQKSNYHFFLQFFNSRKKRSYSIFSVTPNPSNIPSAQGTRGMPYEPTVNAWQMKHVLTYWQSPRHFSHLQPLKIQSEINFPPPSLLYDITIASGLRKFIANFNTCRQTEQLIFSPDASTLSLAVVLHFGSFSTSSMDKPIVPPDSNKSRLSKLRELI